MWCSCSAVAESAISDNHRVHVGVLFQRMART